MRPLVGILMGSDSDMEVMSGASQVLDLFQIQYEIAILSAHRAPKETAAFAKTAKDKGIKVLIAGAGGAAALPGTLASHTTLVVIGVPIKSKSLNGLDALLSIAQMPPGVPVATVGINAAKNAGILAAEILAQNNPKLSGKITAYKEKLRKEVLAKDEKLHKIGVNKYLSEK